MTWNGSLKSWNSFTGGWEGESLKSKTMLDWSARAKMVERLYFSGMRFSEAVGHVHNRYGYIGIYRREVEPGILAGKLCPICRKPSGKKWSAICLNCMISANQEAVAIRERRRQQEEMSADDPRNDWMPTDAEIDEMARNEPGGIK